MALSVRGALIVVHIDPTWALAIHPIDQLDLLETAAPVGLEDHVRLAPGDLAVADIVKVVGCAQADATRLGTLEWGM